MREGAVEPISDSSGAASRWAWSIFALALLLRAAWALYSWQRAGWYLSYDDERLHWELATNLATKFELVGEGWHAPRMPFYPALLACFTPLGAWGVLAARLLQAILGAITAGLVLRWTGEALGTRAGRAAGLLAAVDPFAIFFANLLLTEVVYSLLLVLGGWLIWRVARRKNVTAGTIFAGSAVLAATALTRPETVFLLPPLWIVLLIFAVSRRTAAAFIACSAVLTLSGLGGWAARNANVLGAPVWLTTNGGVTLYDGVGPQARGDSDQSFLGSMNSLIGLSEVDRDRALTRAAWNEMLSDPGRIARLAWIKLRRTWSLTPNVAEYRSGAAAWVGAAYTGLLLALAMIGAARCMRTLGPGAQAALSLAATPIFVITLLACVFVGSVRYRVPLMPLLVVCSGAAIGERQRDQSATVTPAE